MTPKTTLAASAAPRAMFRAPLAASPMLRGPQVAYAPDDGAMDVEAAVAALREPPGAAETSAEPETPAEAAAPAGEAPEAEQPHEESEAEPTAEETLDPEAVIEEPETPEPESDPPQAAIAAPRSWDAAERAAFATLPPQAQEIILKRETERDQAVSRAQNEAAQVRRQAEADLAQLAQIKTRFDDIATKAEQTFADKWSNVDWIALAQNDPQTYNIAKATFDAEQAELQKLQKAKDDAALVEQQNRQVQFQNYRREEDAKLLQIVPELADPKEAPARFRDLGQFLLDRGFPRENIERASAIELQTAWEAQQYRKLIAQGSATIAKPKPTPSPIPNKPAPARSAAPSAAPPARTSTQRTAELAKNRFDQAPTTDNAIAVLRASRGAN